MTPRPRLIALTSPAPGSGKSTVADRLVSEHGFMPVTFALPLKRMTAALLTTLGLPSEEIYARVYGARKHEIIPVLDITSRKLQQLLGTEFGRQLIRDSIWVDIAMTRAAAYLTQGRSVVIDDLRFPNELAAVEAMGGDCLRVVRPNAKVAEPHASEGQLDLIVMPEIWNMGTIADLHSAVDRLLLR